MKRWGTQKEIHLDEAELKTDLGAGNFIFAGSSCDLMADNIPGEWLDRIFRHLEKYPDNTYLLQSKNPARFAFFPIKKNMIISTTVESDFEANLFSNAPPAAARVMALGGLNDSIKKMVTIEPVMDFNTKELLRLIKWVNPIQVNIGADSGNHNLPEPPAEKIKELITELKTFTRVVEKKNLRRLF
jgi:protein gp37